MRRSRHPVWNHKYRQNQKACLVLFICCYVFNFNRFISFYLCRMIFYIFNSNDVE